jgi:hypothetical protein
MACRGTAFFYQCDVGASVVSIVSDYRQDNRAIDVRSPAGAKEFFFSSLCVKTGSGASSDSCPMGTRGPFAGGKARPGRDADHSPPSSVEVVNEQELYLFSPLHLHTCVVGLILLVSTRYYPSKMQPLASSSRRG